MKSFLTGVRDGWQKPLPPGTKRKGVAIGAILGWVVVGAAAG